MTLMHICLLVISCNSGNYVFLIMTGVRILTFYLRLSLLTERSCRDLFNMSQNNYVSWGQF